MAAVVRLKRHLDEEPLSALILNCKKRRKSTESDSGQEISTVLKFAGTVNTQDDDISPHISKLSKNELEQSFKKHIPNITSKLRQQNHAASEENRFKVVNLYRTAENDEKVKINSIVNNQIPLTLLDVEADYYQNDQSNKPIDTNYVYDIYYTNSEGIDDSELDSEFKICPANEIIFDDGLPDIESDDSDDSNAENNWRNDYPDEESENSSIDDEDMRKAMKGLNLEDDLLSDDDESFIYNPDHDATHDDDLYFSDHNSYDGRYASFKRGQKRAEEMYNKDLYHDEVDDTDDDYFE